MDRTRSISWIEASAGSGKTTFIVNQINSLLKQGAHPSSILCLSFTNSAANELKSRFTDADGLNFYTIHGFAMSMLSSPDNLQLIDDQARANLIRDAIEICYCPKLDNMLAEIGMSTNTFASAMEEYLKYHYMHNKPEPVPTLERLQINLSPAAHNFLQNKNLSHLVDILESGNPDLYVKNIITTAGKLNESLANRLMESQELSKALQQAYTHTIQYLEQLAIYDAIALDEKMNEVAQCYHKIAKMRNMLDYDEILRLAAQSPNTAKMMQIKHVFLDEAQDVSVAQLDFLTAAVFSDTVQHEEYSITVVGDVKQLIYDFNGSSEAVFKRLHNYLSQLARGAGAVWTEEKLSHCHRSGNVILNFVDKMMNNSAYSCAHTPGKPLKGKIGCWRRLQTPKTPSQETANSASSTITFYIEQIKKLKTQKLLNENRLIQDSDIFIIVPKRCPKAYLLAYELVKNGIKINEAPFMIPSNGMLEEFIHIGEFAIIQNDLSVLAILKGPFFQWTNEDIQELCINRGPITVWEQLKTKNNDKCRHASKIMSEWLKWPLQTLPFYAKLFFDHEYGELVRANLIEEVELFWEKVLDAKEMTLGDFVNYIQNNVRNFNYGRRGLSILTIHGAKGRENNIVLLFNSHTVCNGSPEPYLFYKNLPFAKKTYPLYKRLKNLQRAHEMRQSQRLLYVTITRAREQLYALPPTEHESIAPNSCYARLMECVDFGDKEYYEISDA